MKKVIILPLLLLQFLCLFLSGCKKSKVSYSFTESIILLPPGTNGSAGRKARYVLFGDWPQEIKSEKVQIDENSFFKKGRFICYFGDDGNYYVKAAENVYNRSSTFSDGTTIHKNNTESRYFKIEPIKWRVITLSYNGENTAYLLSEKMLDSGIPFYPGCTSRTINGKDILANNYKYSTMRAYLNGSYEKDDIQLQIFKEYFKEGEGFLQSAFSENAQQLIQITKVDNSPIQMSYDGENAIQKKFACEDTFDKIFLPSTREITSAGDFGFPPHNVGLDSENKSLNDRLRIRKATDFAVARGVYQSVTTDLGGNWWLRSPYYISNYDIRYVSDNGKMRSTDFVYDEIDGIVPALCVEASF